MVSNIQRLNTALLRLAGYLGALVLFMPLVCAEYQEGIHYEPIPLPANIKDASKIEVVEVFSYGCIHCYRFEPTLESWRYKLSKDVTFRRVPAAFSPGWGRLAQAFHTAEMLGVLDKIHDPLFAAIHEHRLNMSDTSLLTRLFEQAAGIDEETFKGHFTSFETQRLVGLSSAEIRVYRVTHVPSMVVDRRYLVSNEGLEGGNAEMLDVVDFLIQQRRKERAASSSSAVNNATED